MRHIIQSSTRLLLVLVPIACAALGGCGSPSSPAAPTTHEDKIAQIQSNSSLPPSAKATALAVEKAKAPGAK